MKIPLKALTTVLIFAVAASAQNAYDAAVDTFVKSELERQKIPGVSVAIVSDGKPMLVKGYGFANVEHSVAVKPETIFQSGSVGKQFTAMAVMMMVEEGKASLDDKLIKHLPDIPPGWSEVSIRHLLTHTAGLGDYPQDFDYQKNATEAEIFKRLQVAKPAWTPGDRWAYSNVAYVTLGVLIRKLSGKFYGDYLQEKVFKPLGMSTARIISEQDIVANRAGGYVLVNGELKNQSWVAPTLNTTADGALYFTIDDMVKWEAALAGGKLISKTSYEAMWSPVKLNDGSTHPYGFGWMFGSVNGNRVIEHGGAWQGFKAHIARFPDKRITIIVFANLAQANSGMIAHGIAGLIDPALKRQLVVDPDPAQTARMKTLLEQIIAKTADQKRFDEKMQTVIKEQERIFEEMKTLGPIKTFIFVSKAESPQGTGYRYKVEWEGMAISLIVVIDKKGVITGLGVQPQ